MTHLGHDRREVLLVRRVAFRHDDDGAWPRPRPRGGAEQMRLNRLGLSVRLLAIGAVFIGGTRGAAGGADVVVDALARDVRDRSWLIHCATNDDEREVLSDVDRVSLAQDEIV